MNPDEPYTNPLEKFPLYANSLGRVTHVFSQQHGRMLCGVSMRRMMNTSFSLATENVWGWPSCKSCEHAIRRRGLRPFPERKRFFIGCTNREADILYHTSRNSRYVSDPDRELDNLVALGFLEDYGPQSLAGGAHYYVTTEKGREVLSGWRAAHLHISTRRKPSRCFEAWMAFREWNRCTFKQFYKEDWPNIRHKF